MVGRRLGFSLISAGRAGWRITKSALDMALAGLKPNRRGSVRVEVRRAKWLTGSEDRRVGEGRPKPGAILGAHRVGEGREDVAQAEASPDTRVGRSIAGALG